MFISLCHLCVLCASEVNSRFHHTQSQIDPLPKIQSILRLFNGGHKS
jgi:hypothetical protein